MGENQRSIFLFMVIAAGMLHCMVKEVHGQVPATPETEMKCGSCPCGNPCGETPSPPPPPVYPSPPPPIYPSPPPPATSYCPPPPDQYMGIVGTPAGTLYPIDPSFYPSDDASKLTAAVLITVGLIVSFCGLFFSQF